MCCNFIINKYRENVPVNDEGIGRGMHRNSPLLAQLGVLFYDFMNVKQLEM